MITAIVISLYRKFFYDEKLSGIMTFLFGLWTDCAILARLWGVIR